MFKKALFIILIIIISGLSGIIADHYLFPYLSTTDFFNKYKFFKQGAENVTVINKTEQVYVKEDTTLTKIASPIASSIVNIVSYPNPDLKNTTSTSKVQNDATMKNGTGLIATSDGIIMTYATAIDPADLSKTDTPPAYKYKVMVFDGNTYDADLLAVDSYSNLAFLKINASNLPTVQFGNSDDFSAGEKVIAVGNSLAEYQNIYASGILNTFDPYYNLGGKNISSSEKMEGVFRTDLDHEDEYIGGPVIDYSGQVIGIVGSTQRDGGLDYFQIPSNKVKIILDKAIKSDLANNSQLGIYYIPLNKTYAAINNLGTDSGAMIYSPSGQQGLAIIAGTPAAKAGLKINDIITQVAGEKIDDNNSLPDLLYKHDKGENVELTVIRDGQEMKINVQL
jgi:S1-C subfamily serine protease